MEPHLTSISVCLPNQDIKVLSVKGMVDFCFDNIPCLYLL